MDNFSFWNPSATFPKKTQKARGVLALQDKDKKKNLTKLGMTINPHFCGTVSVLLEIGNLDKMFNFPVFVRPCPTVPKHGFVDSRKVETPQEMQKVLEEIVAVEPEAEVLVCTTLNALANYIIYNNNIIAALGNDGATSGHNCLNFAFVPESYGWAHKVQNIHKDFESKKGEIVKDDEIPFLEIVKSSSSAYPYLVQLRAVPKSEAQHTDPDYIPNNIVVEEIIEAKGDLVEWETLMKKNKGKPGLAVDHYGGSLASHFAIHAIINNIPCFTSERPELSKAYEANASKAPELDPDLLLRGYQAAFVAPAPSSASVIGTWAGNRVYFALSMLHNIAAMMRKSSSFEVGYAMGCATRIGFTLCIGEARYSRLKSSTVVKRNTIYAKDLNHPETFWERLLDAHEIHSLYGWSGGYGGKKWANCLEKLVDIHNAVLDKEPLNAVAGFNNIVHLAHNGGWLYNKVLSSGYLSDASTNAQYSLFLALQKDCSMTSTSAKHSMYSILNSMTSLKYGGDVKPLYKINLPYTYDTVDLGDKDLIKEFCKKYGTQRVRAANKKKKSNELKAKSSYYEFEAIAAQIRILDESTDTYRIQIKHKTTSDGGCKYKEYVIPGSLLSKQAKEIIVNSEKHKSWASSLQSYARLTCTGIKAKWLCDVKNKKLIVKLDDLNNYLQKQGISVAFVVKNNF